MAALGRAIGLQSQHVGRALQPPEMQSRVHGVAHGDRLFVSGAVDARPPNEDEQAGRRVVIGCPTPVLCHAGVVTCCWATCVAKGRG